MNAGTGSVQMYRCLNCLWAVMVAVFAACSLSSESRSSSSSPGDSRYTFEKVGTNAQLTVFTSFPLRRQPEEVIEVHAHFDKCVLFWRQGLKSANVYEQNQSKSGVAFDPSRPIGEATVRMASRSIAFQWPSDLAPRAVILRVHFMHALLQDAPEASPLGTRTREPFHKARWAEWTLFLRDPFPAPAPSDVMMWAKQIQRIRYIKEENDNPRLELKTAHPLPAAKGELFSIETYFTRPGKRVFNTALIYLRGNGGQLASVPLRAGEVGVVDARTPPRYRLLGSSHALVERDQLMIECDGKLFGGVVPEIVVVRPVSDKLRKDPQQERWLFLIVNPYLWNAGLPLPLPIDE